MAILLKNLVARTPQRDDLITLSEMIASCENTGRGSVDSLLEDVLSCWQQADFSPTTDAWVIGTTGGEIAGFACVGHEAHMQISAFVWVHPTYRQRGIGTLLLRLIEVRARQHIPLALPAARVVLLGVISKANTGAQRLFEREGYRLKRQFLRPSFTRAEETRSLPVPAAHQKLGAEVNLGQNGQGDVIPLSDWNSFCDMRLYTVYEKEIRPASKPSSDAETELERLNTPANSRELKNLRKNRF